MEFKGKLIAIHGADVAGYSRLMDEDESRQQAKKILTIDPNFTVDSFTDTLPYKNQSDTDSILNALRKAGLK